MDFKDFAWALEGWFVQNYDTRRYKVRVNQVGPQKAEVFVIKINPRDASNEVLPPQSVDLAQRDALERGRVLVQRLLYNQL